MVLGKIKANPHSHFARLTKNSFSANEMKTKKIPNQNLVLDTRITCYINKSSFQKYFRSSGKGFGVLGKQTGERGDTLSLWVEIVKNYHKCKD